jgi:hypothetical protein
MEGQWEDGKMVDGVTLFPNGDIYCGRYNKHEKASGEGKYIYKDGTEYIGGFEDGVPHGQGVEKWADKSEFSGLISKG